MKFTLYVDGGGTPEVPTYFSYQARQNNKPIPSIQVSRFYLKNLSPDLLPDDCSIVDNRGLSTSNIAEYSALYFSILRFKEFYDWSSVTVYQDSQLIVNQVNGSYRCRKDHLKPWLKAVRNIWWPTIELKWVRREKIVEVLGH
jgi:ribonuclease HI